ncbi:hypothetical protein KSF78_0001056 [Schistosoma japonicum]|uniref:Hypotheticial protein n=1 Tax=Schistosoma japonicum TaxID=6182 RepID=C1L7V6_SCHJA|nr:hypothetical protein KSF78_0001056 [Schistosoma japonicum]CAX70783.1 hypotheticial protein [Schistosoma japonicum]CAX70784.1 hypotheticial protein [Schistosoma japonicum]
MLLADVIIYLYTFCITVSANDTKSCAASGFTPLLKCSSCSELNRFKLQKIETSCYRCCEDENVLAAFKYPFAELVTCS